MISSWNEGSKTKNKQKPKEIQSDTSRELSSNSLRNLMIEPNKNEEEKSQKISVQKKKKKKKAQKQSVQNEDKKTTTEASTTADVIETTPDSSLPIEEIKTLEITATEMTTNNVFNLTSESVLSESKGKLEIIISQNGNVEVLAEINKEPAPPVKITQEKIEEVLHTVGDLKIIKINRKRILGNLNLCVDNS